MEPVDANNVAEQHPPPRYHEVESISNANMVTPVMQQHFPEGRRGYPPSVQRAAGPDLGLQHNSPMNMQDLGPSSRLTLPSSYAFRLPPTGSGSERPMHEEAAEVSEMNQITVLRRGIAEAERQVQICELEAQLEMLKFETPTRGETPQQEEPDSSPDKSGFPRYRNPVDSGSRYGGNGWEGTFASPPFRPYAPPPPPPAFTQSRLDVSRIPVDAIKRSTSDEIKLSTFNFLNLLDSVGLKYVCIGE